MLSSRFGALHYTHIFSNISKQINLLTKGHYILYTIYYMALAIFHSPFIKDRHDFKNVKLSQVIY